MTLSECPPPNGSTALITRSRERDWLRRAIAAMRSSSVFANAGSVVSSASRKIESARMARASERLASLLALRLFFLGQEDELELAPLLQLAVHALVVQRDGDVRPAPHGRRDLVDLE